MTKSLKQEYLKAILDDAALQGTIAAFNGKSAQSVVRWAKNGNQKRLTAPSTLQAMAKYLKVKQEELLKAA